MNIIGENEEHLENVLYIRHNPGKNRWEAFGRARDDGFIASLPGRAETIRHGFKMLWAMNAFGPDRYREQMALMAEEDFPSDIAFPVEEEPPKTS